MSSSLLHFLLSPMSFSFFSFFHLETQIKSVIWGKNSITMSSPLWKYLVWLCRSIVCFLCCLWFSSLFWNSNFMSLYFKLQQPKYVTRLQVKCLILHEKTSCDVLIRCNHIFWAPTIWIIIYAVLRGIVRTSEMAQWVKGLAANLNSISGIYIKMKVEKWPYKVICHRYTVVWTHTQIIIIKKTDTYECHIKQNSRHQNINHN